MNVTRTRNFRARIALVFWLGISLFFGLVSLHCADPDSNLGSKASPTGETRTFLKTECVGVLFLVFSPDGSELAATCQFLPPMVWDTATWRILRRLPGLRMTAYSPDSAMMATAEGRDGLRLWRKNEFGDSRPFRTLAGKGPAIRYVAFSPDGKTLASTHENNVIKIWDVATGRHQRTLHGHTAAVYRNIFSSDGKILISGSRDSTVRLWNTTTWEEIKSLPVPEGAGEVLGLALSPDGKTLATVHRSIGVMIWNTETWTETIKTGYYCAAFSPDGKTLAMGRSDIALWDVSAGEDIGTITLPELTLKEALPEKRAASLVASGQGIKLDTKFPVYVGALAYSPDGKWLAAAATPSTVRLVDLAKQ